MSQVIATIAGRQFRLACEDGQEDHLQALAKDIDQRIIDLRRKFGEIGDTRLTVMAALMVAWGVVLTAFVAWLYRRALVVMDVNGG